MQLDQGERGFSFQKEGPLDMRMDQQGPLTAGEIVNRWSFKRLVAIFQEYGEERRAKTMARTIIAEREKEPILTTTALADILSRAVGHVRGKLHPATLVFQALRMAVNGELHAIEKGLSTAISALSPSGRLGVITFHGLEDRLVSGILRRSCRGKKHPVAHFITDHVMRPTAEEKGMNRRSRSAKLRAIEKAP
ncbi:MAG: 16S rRNA (cytosine(1402)-N(4))-methyltransferase RsmH [Chlamydiota bacterium]|nr:16S rRNA (cytosine(1402)-N(4))-methyltransferase RsmH [Chlamydiota bacterium]